VSNPVSRRAVLGGAAAGVAGAALAPLRAAHADGDPVDAVASRLDRELVELRRAIHRHPETAGQEQRTAALVAQRLRAAGLAVTTGVGGHGVVGILPGAHRGRTVAYRADMDAVPPADQVGGGPQPAHVCGHDVHTTVGVGVPTSGTGCCRGATGPTRRSRRRGGPCWCTAISTVTTTCGTGRRCGCGWSLTWNGGHRRARVRPALPPGGLRRCYRSHRIRIDGSATGDSVSGSTPWRRHAGRHSPA
jgi:hypothetical protein